jgi:hypothetical protein
LLESCILNDWVDDKNQSGSKSSPKGTNEHITSEPVSKHSWNLTQARLWQECSEMSWKNLTSWQRLVDWQCFLRYEQPAKSESPRMDC